MSFSEEYDGMMKMDGHDDDAIGICYRFGQEPCIAYDWDKVIQTLVNMGMTYIEAVEFHDFNQAGAWVGEDTPCFVRSVE